MKDQQDSVFHKAGENRWLGAPAKYAEKEFDTPGQAMREFEKVTRQCVSDEGCNCCGAPHSFNWKDSTGYNYVSGEECLDYMYRSVPRNLRDTCSDEIE